VLAVLAVLAVLDVLAVPPVTHAAGLARCAPPQKILVGPRRNQRLIR